MAWNKSIHKTQIDFFVAAMAMIFVKTSQMEPLRLDDPEGNGKWYKVTSREVKKHPPLEFFYRTYLDSVYDEIKTLQKNRPQSTIIEQIEVIKNWSCNKAWIRGYFPCQTGMHVEHQSNMKYFYIHIYAHIHISYIYI